MGLKLGMRISVLLAGRSGSLAATLIMVVMKTEMFIFK